MPGQFLGVLLISSLSSAEAGRTRRWRPRPRTPGSAELAFARAGESWSSGANLSVTPDELADRLDSRKLREKLNRQAGDLVCGENPPVDSSSERQKCPAKCPVLAEERGNGVHCDFHCVEATSEACTELNDKATVADKERGFCRPCAVMGCRDCLHDGTDTCLKCSQGFYLRDGKCQNPFWWCWWVFGVAVVGITAVLVLWVVDLSMRPVTNQKRLDHALDVRSRAKLRQPKIMPTTTWSFGSKPSSPSGAPEKEEYASSDHRPLWPMSTNLCREAMVGGPGLTLAFNFQVAIIIWGLTMGICWLLLGVFVDTDLFIMGTRRWDSPRQQCMVIAWGYETQKRLMWAKVGFLAFAYTFTFFGSLMFSIRQLRIFQRMDLDVSTHKDFCAVASGLSGIGGEERLEELLKEFFQKETGKTVIAVSVSWVYEDVEDKLMSLVEEDMLLMHKKFHKASSPRTKEADDDDSMSDSKATDDQETERQMEEDRSQSVRTRLMRSVESAFLSTTVQKALTRGRAKGFDLRYKERHHEDKPELADDRVAKRVSKDASLGEEHNQSVKDLLVGMKTSGKAFIIFNTEQDRDDAVADFKKNAEGMIFKDKTVTLERAMVEPEGVRWENFCDETEPFGLTKKVVGGMVSIAFALCIWAGVFYLPFVWISASSSYTYGSAPSDISVFTFSMIVVLGNAMMYTTCSEVTDRMRFPFRKDHEVCYMMFYTVSCTFNVILDLVITCFIAYWKLAGLGTRMYGGEPISEAPTAISLLMTYGMQRELGENTMAYAWPGTFFIPFLIEPIAAVYLPYKLMTLLVRTHSDIHTSSAEAYLASIPFDLSRYADIHLNVILAVLILFFPGGYNTTIFFGLAVAHVWIYLYDHVRVLRFCPGFTYASNVVDWWAQWMLAFPCAILLTALTWKVNQELNFWITKTLFGKLGDPQQSSIGIAVTLAAVFCGHILLHTWLLEHIVPKFGISEEHEENEDTYRDCAERLPCSWLTSNPVQCLRSDYIYHHEPPIVFCELGKEHLMLRNDAVGQFFEDSKSKAEAQDAWSATEIFTTLQRFRSGDKISAPV